MTRQRRLAPVAAPPGGLARPRLPALLLVLATTLTYVNSLSVPFIFDDQYAIVENETIRSLSPLSAALRAPAQSATAGRPIVNLSLALNYATGGLSPAGYHVWNLAVHLAAGLLLFGIIRRTWAHEFERGRLPSSMSPDATLVAASGALLWLLHPIQSEVIDYVVQRTESMMGLASLATLYLTIRGLHAPSPARWYIGATVACAVGMGAKESMVTTPLLVLLYDMVFGARQLRGALRARWGLYIGLAACWLILIPLVASGPRSHSAGLSSGISPWTYFVNQPAVIARYLRLVVWPAGLVIDYGLPQDSHWQDALLPGAALLALAGATVMAWFRDRRLAFMGAWFFLTLAPTSSLLPIATEVGAERRMYLPLAAIAAFAVWALRRLVRDRRTFALVAGVVAVALGTLTVQRNAEYADPVQLWQTVVERHPHGRAHYNLGIVLKAAGRRAEAIQQFEIAAPQMPDAEYALGFELAVDGHHADAVRHLRRYTQLRPDDINVIRGYNLMGRSQLSLGALDAAAASFGEVLRMQPRNLDALAWLGEARLGQGRIDEAIDAFGSAVVLAPRDAGLHMNLANSLATAGRIDEAIAACRRALEVEPNATARQEIANVISQLEMEQALGPKQRGASR